MEGRMRTREALIILLLVTAASSGALPLGLSSRATTWFEAGFAVAWNPVRGVPMIGWQYRFQLGTPVAIGVTVYVSESGGYATLDGTWFANPTPLGNSITLPLAFGIGLARKAGNNPGLTLAFHGGASWYPVTVPNSVAARWIFGLGAEIGTSLYLSPWGIEPLLSAGLLMPVNISTLDTSP